MAVEWSLHTALAGEILNCTRRLTEVTGQPEAAAGLGRKAETTAPVGGGRQALKLFVLREAGEVWSSVSQTVNVLYLGTTWFSRILLECRF